MHLAYIWQLDVGSAIVGKMKKNPSFSQLPANCLTEVGKPIIRAVIFDMDGVIINSEVQWKAIEKDFLVGLIPSWTEKDQQGIIGMSLFDVWRKLKSEFALEISEQEFVGFYRGLAGEIYGNRADPIPGAIDLVRAAFNSGFQVALASSSPRSWIEIVVNRFCLQTELQVSVSSEDVGGVGKPAPDIYQLALSRLGIKPEEAVAVEDTTKGIASAKGAGMYCVGLLNETNSRQQLAAADIVLESLVGVNLEELIVTLCPTDCE